MAFFYWLMPWGCEQTLATGIGDFLHEPLDLQRQSKGLGAGTLQGLPWGEGGRGETSLALGSHLGTSSTYSRSSGTTV